MKKILIFRFSSLGDVALTVPVVTEALRQNPELHITMVTPEFFHSLFPIHQRLHLVNFDKSNQHKGIKGLWSLFQQLNQKKYDALLDLHSVLRTYFLDNCFRLSGTKVKQIDKGRKEKKALSRKQNKILKPLQPTTERYAEVFRQAGIEVKLSHRLENFIFPEIQPISRHIGIAPFAKHQAKMYNLDKMKQLVEMLSRQNYTIKIFGAKSELESIQNWNEIAHVDLIKSESFAEELKQIATLEMMISMDSANMHLASLLGVKVLSIWGGTHPFAGFLGYGQKMTYVLQDETLDWRPNSIYGNRPGPTENPNGMENISPNDVMKKVDELLLSKKSSEI